MLRLQRLPPPNSAEVFVKLEYLNPGGSVKDRAAIGIIERAEREGRLKPGGVIVEATAGNTGIGLALIGVNRGYQVALFVPENFSEEKVIIMRALGAEVVRTPDEEGMSGAIRRAQELADNTPGAFMAAQFENPANPDYHYQTTAQEIFEQMEGRIDAVVDAGPARHGVETTVLDVTQSPMIVYRPGAVTLEALRGVAGDVRIYEGNGTEGNRIGAVQEPAGLPSPGIGIRHYAPRAHMVLVETQGADEEAVVGFRLFQAVAKLKREGDGVRVGVMAPEEFKSDVRTADAVFGWGRWGDLDSLAQRLFAGLRWLDAQEASHIVCPLPAERGIGRALRDRLEKAARLPVVKS